MRQLNRSPLMGPAILNWIRASFDVVRTSLWLVPTVMLLLGIGLAVILLRLNSAPSLNNEIPYWLSSGSGEDARNLLSTLLTAVITMAGIVFSVTVVSLSLAANAYGPRLIRTFRADRSTQFALGTFIMTIVYLLLVLRAVRGEAPEADVPEAAVALGSLLALACVLALLGFIQGVSSLIVADEVVRRVRAELDAAIDGLPAADGARPLPHPALPRDFEARKGAIRLPKEGYVQSVEYHQIQLWAEKHQAVVRLDIRPGDFAVDGDHKVLIYPAPADPERPRREIDRYIVSGPRRTPAQDLEFSVRHLVEVAVRALSPGVNDPFTAIAVIDRLRGALARLAERQLPAAFLTDAQGALRVMRHVSDFRGITDASFDQIRQSGAGMPAILIHMLRSLGALAEHLRTEEQRSAVAHHLRLIRAAAGREPAEASDIEDVEREYERAVDALGARCSGA